MGVVCAVIGVLILAITVGILASSFNDKLFNYNRLDKHCERRKKREGTSVRSGNCLLSELK